MQGTAEQLKDAETAIKFFGDVSAQIGQITDTVQTGISDLTEDTMTLTQTTSDAIATNANTGGPGVGDVIHFYKNVRMIWSFFNGQLRLCPLDFAEVFISAAGLQNNPAGVGVSQADAQLLLSFDPLVGAAPGSAAGGSFYASGDVGIFVRREPQPPICGDTRLKEHDHGENLHHGYG